MIGIIGGTGLYRMDGLKVNEARPVDTPFGAPSAPVMLGSLDGKPVAFLARHGLEHHLLPGEINFRANIWALKSLGVRTVIGVSAVGSLREEIRPGDLALPAQYLDFTKGLRAASFFGQGMVAHISTAHPACAATSALLAEAAEALGLPLHREKTYAYHLARRKVGSIGVYDPRTPAAGATGRAGGVVTEQLWNEWDVEVTREAHAEYRALARRHRPDAYSENGFVRWTKDPVAAAVLLEAVERLRSWQVDVKAVGPSELSRWMLWPAFGPPPVRTTYRASAAR